MTVVAASGDKTPRVLVLGSQNHGRGVRAHEWHRIPAGLNVADYDAVILNFVPLAEEEALHKNISLAHVPSLDQFVRLLFTDDSIVIAFGDPDLQFGETPTEGGRRRIGTFEYREA